jgi:hypothetical protein
MVSGSLLVLRLLPPLKLVAMILLKMALNTKNQSFNGFQEVFQSDLKPIMTHPPSEWSQHL